MASPDDVADPATGGTTVAGGYQGTSLNPSGIRYLLLKDGGTTHRLPLTQTLKQTLVWVYGPGGPQPGARLSITERSCLTPLGGYRIVYVVVPSPVPVWEAAA
jgi:hypothetical protein